MLSIFAPTNKITGGAVFFSFNSKDGSVFTKLIKQTANNADKKNNFDGQNPINVKFTQDEVGDIIRVIRVKGECSFYHTFGDDKTTGSFRYWEMPVTDKQGKAGVKGGFGLSVSKNGKEIKVGISLGAAERLSEYLKFALDHIFSADYALDKKKSEEWAKKKDAQKPEAVVPTEDTGDVESVPSEEQDGVPF